MLFGDRLKSLRTSNNLQQNDIAKILKVDRSTVGKWENNSSLPDLAKLSVIAAYFGVSTDYLIKGSTDKSDLSLIPQNLIKLQSKKIPLLGTIAAGKPILTEENINEYIDVDTLTKADFCLRIQGDSMVNAGINDGDIVFIREQEDVENGEIAAVLIGDIDTYEMVATLKRVYKIEHGVQLVAENPKYPPMFFNSENSVSIRIIGKATHLLCNVK